jgi:GNAT superfamily N-acetyltransferase/SAM-dependent methyltransferase
MLFRARERLGMCKCRFEASFILSDGFYLPFKSYVFDGATLNWVLAHIPLPLNVKFVSEISRVVRNGGWLFISDSYWRGQEGGKEQIQTREAEGKRYKIYKYYYEPDELKLLIEKTFGKVETLKPLHYELICIAKKISCKWVIGMCRVEELKENFVKKVDTFLHKDPFVNAYAIWDLHYLRHRTKFFLCMDGVELKGLLLDYLGHIGVHFLWLWGEEKAVEKLLDAVSADKMIFHVFPEFESIIRRKFAITAKYHVDFMLLRKGEERLYINHEIRPLSLADVVSFASLRKEAPSSEDIKEAESFLKEISFYGVFEDDKLISVACVQAMIPEIWILGGFYTKPEYRNKGCATSLASFLVEKALAETNHVGLHVREDNYPAKHVYEKVGFKLYRKMCWLEYNVDIAP